ncbi:hypothetical protein C7974DRAFT_180390 [Boeremia exigua]|uniref:uncharacterized protein n=1 Tax=Boeremia exigua TaxID=749465 RepID=UPI001E8D6C41|nr:uncharacterized protein C7974DRAFT_180390 [Boeremia exigua]KAH6629070.1 hypothetical protein C7974DRAFT_180390 [Boeremia exigua]
MAEVVGLIASIATLIEVAGKTGRTISRIRKLQSSPPRYILAAQNEIERFTAALDLIQDILNSRPTAPSDKVKLELTRLHKQAINALQEFDDFLKLKVIHDTPDGDGTFKLRRRAKVKEVFGEAQSEFVDFHQQLVSIKQNMQLVLQALHFHSHGGSLHLQSVSIVQAGITTIVKAGDNEVTATHLEKAVVSSTSTAIASGRPSVQPISPSAVALKEDYVVFKMQRASQECRQQCPCQCHIALRGSTPRWLQGLMGTVFLSLSGVPLINRRVCDFKGCSGKGAANGAARLQYVMPTWALPYAIETTATWRTLGGVGGTWTLRIPRFMNTNNLYSKFLWMATRGTVEDFQKLMSVSGMRAFDAFDTSLSINSTLFALAVNNMRFDICNMLLENGVDVSYRDACGVSMAGCYWQKCHAFNASSDISVPTVLVEAFDTLNITPGHSLVVENRFEDVGTHLRNFPAAITLRDDNGFTLFHWAAARGSMESLDALLQAGADVNAVCKRGRTPLMWAVCTLHEIGIWKILIRAGADVNMTDLQGYNALMWLLSHTPTPDTVALLLDAGTDIHHISDYHVTALEMVSSTPGDGIVESCRTLLERGAVLNRITCYGWSPVVIAIQNNNHGLLELYIEHGAIWNTVATGNGTKTVINAAIWADIRTMAILRDARIQGVHMDDHVIKAYWSKFDKRDALFCGFREPIEDERKAFQELLDSVIPLDSSLIVSQPTQQRLIPGAFPTEEYREQGHVVSYSKPSDESEIDGDTDQSTSEREYFELSSNQKSDEDGESLLTDENGLINLEGGVSS